MTTNNTRNHEKATEQKDYIKIKCVFSSFKIFLKVFFSLPKAFANSFCLRISFYSKFCISLFMLICQDDVALSTKPPKIYSKKK